MEVGSICGGGAAADQAWAGSEVEAAHVTDAYSGRTVARLLFSSQVFATVNAGFAPQGMMIKTGTVVVAFPIATRVDCVVMVPRQTSSGHAQGVSTLSTFAKWARVAEQMTASEQDVHARRAAAHQDATERYGEWASKIVAARQPGTCSG